MYSQNNNCKVHSHLYAPISKDINGICSDLALGFPEQSYGQGLLPSHHLTSVRCGLSS